MPSPCVCPWVFVECRLFWTSFVCSIDGFVLSFSLAGRGSEAQMFNKKGSNDSPSTLIPGYLSRTLFAIQLINLKINFEKRQSHTINFFMRPPN